MTRLSRAEIWCNFGRHNFLFLIGMPLAVSFSRKERPERWWASPTRAVVVSQQLGNHGLLRPSVAGWSPLRFTAAGTYFYLENLPQSYKGTKSIFVPWSLFL